MRLAADFWTSKMTWTAVITTVVTLYGPIVEKRLPSREELEMVLIAWSAAFIRDTTAKAAEGRLMGQERGGSAPVSEKTKTLV